MEAEILAGFLQIMKCSDAQVDTAQMSLPVRLDGLGIHLMYDQDGATCDAAFLAAAALTHRAVSAGSEHFDPFKSASGVELSALSDVYDRVVPRMSAASVSTLGAVLTDAMGADVLPGFAHSVSAELAEFPQVLLRDGLLFQDRSHVECIADVTARAWLDAMPTVSNRVLGDGDVFSSLRDMLGVCPAALQDKPLFCECGKPLSPGQAMWCRLKLIGPIGMRCRCCAGVRTVCHDISVESGWCVCVFINLDKPALGSSLLTLICRVCLYLIRLWLMVSVLTSTLLIWLAVLVRMS